MEYPIKKKNFLLHQTKLLALCLLALVSAGIYLNSLHNAFTNWDDSMIYGNPQIRSLSWENIKSIFSYVKGSTYQPISPLTH